MDGSDQWRGSKAKVLVLFHKQLGDLVTLQPALKRLSDHIGRQVHVWTRPAFDPVLQLMPCAQLVHHLFFKKYDAVFAYDFGSLAARQAACLRSKHKSLLIPYDFERRWYHPLVYRSIECHDYAQRYIARYYWDHTLGSERDTFQPPHLETPTAEGQWAEIRPQALINPCSAWRRKGFTIEGWRAAIRLLIDHGISSITLTGGAEPWHTEYNQAVAKGFEKHVHNLTAQTNLKDYIGLISRARLVLSVDGAAAHLAKAFGIPSLTLFGPSYKHRWHYESAEHIALAAADYAPSVERPSAELIPLTDVLQHLQPLIEKVKSK